MSPTSTLIFPIFLKLGQCLQGQLQELRLEPAKDLKRASRELLGVRVAPVRQQLAFGYTLYRVHCRRRDSGGVERDRLSYERFVRRCRGRRREQAEDLAAERGVLEAGEAEGLVRCDETGQL